jgi:hypothetical protein
MRPARSILTLTLVVTLLTPVHAAPPALFNPQSKTLTTRKFVPGGRPAAIKAPPRFVVPQTAVVIRAAPVPNVKPPVVNLKPPVVNLKPPVIVPKAIPGGALLPIARPAEDRLRDRIPGLRDDVARLELPDSDRDGVPDFRDPERFDPGLVDLGDGGGADPADPADPAPPVADAGPTAWDWVAIGLAAAAFADGRADRHGGGCPGGGVVIERPLVQTVPADPIIVYDEAVTVTPAPSGDAIVISEPGPTASPADEDSPAAAESAVAAGPEPLPQLRAGEGFQLPAKGLGGKQGRVAVKIGVVILECPVTVWNEAGLEAAVPATTLEAAASADLIVALADGTIAAVVPVELLPARQAVAAAK